MGRWGLKVGVTGVSLISMSLSFMKVYALQVCVLCSKSCAPDDGGVTSKAGF